MPGCHKRNKGVGGLRVEFYAFLPVTVRRLLPEADKAEEEDGSDQHLLCEAHKVQAEGAVARGETQTVGGLLPEADKVQAEGGDMRSDKHLLYEANKAEEEDG
ncbi:hypothetical protein [Arcticibacter sp. MXS-1]|uniref:hypothetical protein n=1 Tax=Arcticibacter sp. MXS-1 TaxID=3341726 RepID=UPI0035A8B2AB